MVNKKDDLAPIEIDLNQINNNKLNESWLAMFGGAIKAIMQRMFGGDSLPIKVKGNRQQVKSFGQTIGREKAYIQAVAKYGLNDPKTYKNKFSLYQAISRFERLTGLKWPFKN